jgi:hypothetical protein
MVKMSILRSAWPLVAALLAASLLACAPKTKLRPQVLTHPSRFPHSLGSQGVVVAVVPFDGRRDVYSDPEDPRPARPDFDWLKAGVRPTRIILANESPNAVRLDPTQVSAVGEGGVVYQAYAPREAADAVVASEAFGAHLRRGLKGALAGGALGAGVGAALGAVSGYRGYGGSAAAQGAAWGGILGGVQGLMVGAAGGREELERRVRLLIDSRQLPAADLAPGMTREGLVFFPAAPIRAVRLVMTTADRQASWTMEIPVSLPPAPVAVDRKAASLTIF